MVTPSLNKKILLNAYSYRHSYMLFDVSTLGKLTNRISSIVLKMSKK